MHRAPCRVGTSTPVMPPPSSITDTEHPIDLQWLSGFDVLQH